MADDQLIDDAPDVGAPSDTEAGAADSRPADGVTEPASTDRAPRTRSKGARSREERAADREARKLENAESIAAGEEPKPRRGRKPGSTNRAKYEPIASRLNDSIQAIAFVAGFFNAADGEIIAANAEGLAAALDALARENPAVYRALVAMMSGSAWMGVGMAAFPIVVGIAANHGVGPFGGKKDDGSTAADGRASEAPPSGAATGTAPAPWHPLAPVSGPTVVGDNAPLVD